MTARYIREVKPVDDWHVMGFDKNSAEYKQAASLIKEGKLSLYNSADGRYTNIASLNEKDVRAIQQKGQVK